MAHTHSEVCGITSQSSGSLPTATTIAFAGGESVGAEQNVGVLAFDHFSFHGVLFDCACLGTPFQVN